MAIAVDSLFGFTYDESGVKGLMPMINKLREMIESRQVTKYSIYKDGRISKQTVYNLVNNPSLIPDGKTLEVLCDFFQCQPNELLEWIPE
ncbi:helix-turn-helix transcriptional regulator [Limnoraphis robusta Tam1]|uniref:Helix-turn-helix transcriptional regulator n=1 Tax=Limnoraphis robusta CCNP1315 TaxID=3110306 RepID=A0ABU5U4R1_9CYAN|nr:helix-turn-helix transcriptional regulator [Limnoraphis robusta]MEA5498342.1 helix-turn-helix transcriptional regulator [Limnoraphis robusta BA-68 BA1]MEA5521628.1 helix-turn-helix transcriptional regulator [Limnoraphis robusta CCNP1315]MEA5540366.1 helix-turn-helix transcriptional regulator [Limnoraphis robusta Tam1]MEA5545188.1 helix-turn-helix transcriptional regulator [Limnoraphis robusta CCNP1324]